MSHEQFDAYGLLYPAFKYGLDRKYERIVTGTENIPDVPAIYVPNHIIFADSPLVAVSYTEATGKPMRFVVKKEYADGKGIDSNGKLGRTMRLLVGYTHMIAVDRQSTRRQDFMNFQRDIETRLIRGDAVGGHGEGTRVESGKIYKMRAGLAQIALDIERPLVPVGVNYGDPLDEGGKIPARIAFGVPVMPEEFNDAPYKDLPHSQRARLLMQTIEDRVAELTGFEQTHEYAPLPIPIDRSK